MRQLTRYGRRSGRFWWSGLSRPKRVDFLWEARVRERYLGQQIGSELGDDEASQEFSRVAILSVLDGRCYAAMCLVEGEGAAVALLWKRRFGSLGEAEFELLWAR